MHCQVQQEQLILIVRVYNRARTCARTALLGKENNITTLKGLPCFIWLKWVNKGPIVHTHFLYHDTYSSFKHYILFLISIIYSLEFVLFRSSAVSKRFLYFCSIFWSAVEWGSHSYDNLFPVNFKPFYMPNSALCANAATCKSPQLEDKEDFLVFEGPSFVWIWTSLSIAAANVFTGSWIWG